MAGITVPIVASADTAGIAKFERQFEAMSNKLKKQQAGFASFGKALKGALAVGAVAALGKRALDEAQQAYQVTALTNTIIKNTGASAWTTSQQVSTLSTSLSNLTGIDDELIQAGSNVLLSFGNIRNAGTGASAVFDRATAAAVDMGKALGVDTASAAKMLGKALADPVAGMGRLAKAGVVLTNEQKAQIKAMQQRGDLLGAQQVILGAVEGKFKGAAAAMASPMERLQTMLNNLLEAAGTGLMPALSKIVDSLMPLFTALQPVLLSLGGALGLIIEKVAAGLVPVMAPLAQVLGVVGQLLGNVLGSVLPPLAAALGQVLVAISPLLVKVAEFVGVLVEALMPILQPLLDALSPIIDALVAGLSPILDVVISLVKVLAPPLAVIAQAFGQIIVPLLPLITLIGMLVALALKPLIGVFNLVMPLVTKFFEIFGRFAGWFLGNVVSVLISGFKTLAKGIAGFFSFLGNIPFIGKYFNMGADAINKFVTQLDSMNKTSVKVDTSAASSLATQSQAYASSAKQLQAGAAATVAAGKDFAKGTKPGKGSAGSRAKVTTPKTRISSPVSKTAKSAPGSFMVAGSRGGLSLSVTVNGSVVQERDIARTIRDELLQFARRQGVRPNFGV